MKEKQTWRKAGLPSTHSSPVKDCVLAVQGNHAQARKVKKCLKSALFLL
jgi:hypothetical protein